MSVIQNGICDEKVKVGRLVMLAAGSSDFVLTFYLAFKNRHSVWSQITGST